MYYVKFKTASNQADWSTVIYMIDKTSGNYMDLSHVVVANVALQILDQPNSPVLQGALSSGEISIPAPGTIWVYFPATRMQGLTPGSYKVGLTIQADDGRVTQVILGMLPVAAGMPGMSVRPNVWGYS